MNGEPSPPQQQGCSAEYLIRFSQQHEAFRRAEIEAIAELLKLDMEITFYDSDVGFARKTFPQPPPPDIYIPLLGLDPVPLLACADILAYSLPLA